MAPGVFLPTSNYERDMCQKTVMETVERGVFVEDKP